MATLREIASVHDGEPDRLSQRALRALDETDKLPPHLRGCVHEFGFAIVSAMIQNGVTTPGRIRQLVHECWQGPRTPNQGKGGTGIGQPSSIINSLDWLLIQSEAKITARTLLRVLWSSNLAIVPCDPSSVMVEASIATVRDHTEVMTKSEKHRRRLKAAIDAAARRMWPHLFEDAKK